MAKGKPVRCIDDGLEFGSIKAASEHYRVAGSNISNQIAGRIKHISGLHFELIAQEEYSYERKHNI